MRRIFTYIGRIIRTAIDFFYPPFSRYCSKQFFRYGVCGVANVVFDWVLYFLVYNYVFQKNMIELPFITISAHIAALLVTFPITLFSGFLLQKYVTFTSSDLRGHRQLIRYVSVVGVNLIINYLGLKLFVEVFRFYPTLSKMLTTIICTFFSYFSQKHFTFKSSEKV